MIELNWGIIRDDKFQTSFAKLMGTGDTDWSTKYAISRIGKKITSEIREAQEEFLKLVMKYADIDPNGGYKVKEEHKDTWTKEITAFLETKFVVDRNPVDIKNLTNVKLSPSDVLTLEPLLAGLEDLEKEAKQ
jgi:hypothetical protein